MKPRSFLLACGLLSSLLYVGTDVYAAARWEGYSYADQAISELSAIGAPTRQLWVTVMALLYGPLLTAFGAGVRLSARGRPLRTAGTLLALWGVSGYAWFFFPMHMRGAIGSATDAMHLVLAAVTVTLILLCIVFGAAARGKAFRAYSALTIVLMLGFGAAVAMQAPQVAAQAPTPWMGIMERVSVYSSMLWVAVLSAVLLLDATPAAAAHGPDRA